MWPSPEGVVVVVSRLDKEGERLLGAERTLRPPSRLGRLACPRVMWWELQGRKGSKEFMLPVPGRWGGGGPIGRWMGGPTAT